MFLKYRSIENHYRQNFIDSFKERFPLLENETFVIQEKIDGCLEENSLLETLEFGFITIKEIVSKQLNCHVKSYDIINNEIVFDKVVNFSKEILNKKWFEIELETGEKLIATGNHKVWIPNLKCWRRVDELTINDSLFID